MTSSRRKLNLISEHINKLVNNYKKWKCVNSAPHKMECSNRTTALACSVWGGEFDLFKSCYNCFKNGMKMESFIIIEKD